MEMEKMQSKGEVDEEGLRALEMNMTGKMLLASWRGARFEVIQVLREVRELASILYASLSGVMSTYSGCGQRAQRFVCLGSCIA